MIGPDNGILGNWESAESQYQEQVSGLGARFTDEVGIFMEIGVIRRILKRAKRWHIIADDVRPLRETRSVGRALEHEDKLMLLRIAGSRPDWQVARCAATVALNTTMRGCELRGLRWRDVNLLDHMLTVRRSKTEG